MTFLQIQLNKQYIVTLAALFIALATFAQDGEFADYPNDVDIQDSAQGGYRLTRGLINRSVTDLVVPNTVGDVPLAVTRTFSQETSWTVYPFYKLRFKGEGDGIPLGLGDLECFVLNTPEGMRYVAETWTQGGTRYIEPLYSEKTNFNRYFTETLSNGNLRVTVAMQSGLTAVFESKGVFQGGYNRGPDDIFRMTELRDKYGRSLTYTYRVLGHETPIK